MRTLNLLEKILIISLIIALVCSVMISYHVYICKDKHYSESFSAWQMPMIFAILGDLYFLKFKSIGKLFKIK